MNLQVVRVVCVAGQRFARPVAAQINRLGEGRWEAMLMRHSK
ncbi:MAG TPA: hypothetical protein VNU44_16420 [Bryobacteraceae bacterium]|nr:hypothetical protein [Bryobacteraceae bacterium]